MRLGAALGELEADGDAEGEAEPERTLDLSSPYSTSVYVLPFAMVIFGDLNENVSVVSFKTDLSNVQIGR